jgi:hypothetical protein
LLTLHVQSVKCYSLAHTKQKLTSTKQLLETQKQLEYEKTAKDTIEAALLKKSGDFENLTADYKTSRKRIKS